MPPLNQQLMITTANTRFVAAARRLAPAAKSEHDDHLRFIAPICKAICDGHNDWRLQAFLKDIVISGPIAEGGSLEGPDLKHLIERRAPRTGFPQWAPKYTSAIAAAIGDAWKAYQRSFRVPGLPWYPAFAAWPGPEASPTPNTPTPLARCVPDRSTITTAALKRRMTTQLGRGHPLSAPLFESIAAAFEAVVVLWSETQQITNVMGRGPVPTWAPPYVPAGPVVFGDTIGAPGHIGA